METIIFTTVACLLSSGLMGVIAYFIIKRFVENEQKKSLLELKKMETMENLRVVNPIRLQAYERLALFLERITPNSLVLRCYQPGMDLKVLQGVMTKNIRDEFEHNLAQRLYVTEETWRLIVLSKEEVLQNINEVFNNNPDANVTAIAQQLVSFDNTMVEKAVINIKREFNSL